MATEMTVAGREIGIVDVNHPEGHQAMEGRR